MVALLWSVLTKMEGAVASHAWSCGRLLPLYQPNQPEPTGGGSDEREMIQKCWQSPLFWPNQPDGFGWFSRRTRICVLAGPAQITACLPRHAGVPPSI